MKPKDSSLSIAYNIQMKNKRKKMAEGGKIEKSFEIDEVDSKGRKIASQKPLIVDQVSDDEMKKQEKMAHDRSVADAIMRRRKMAKGGEVKSEDERDEMLEWNAKEHGNYLDELNNEALDSENYSEESALDETDQPNDSNLHGDDIEADKHDRIAQMRRKMKLKRGL